MLKYSKLLAICGQTDFSKIALRVFLAVNGKLFYSASFNNEGASVKVSSMWSPVVTACCLDTGH